MKKLTVIVAIGFLALVGCATPQLDINEPDPAAERLAEVAESILDLARIENDVMASRYLNDGGRVTAPIDTYHIPSVNRVISFGDNWIGPLFQIVDKLSVAGGLNPPRYLGVKPPGDVIVQVNTDFRPVIDMLQDVGVKAGSQAMVTLKVKEKLIEVRYLNL